MVNLEEKSLLCMFFNLRSRGFFLFHRKYLVTLKHERPAVSYESSDVSYEKSYYTLSATLRMIFLLMEKRKIAENVKDASSAIGNDHHTALNPPIFDKIYAAGSSTKS